MLSAPPPTLVLGLGNDILTDDGVGLFVVRQLAASMTAGNFTFRDTTEMGLALLDQITGFERAAIIDSIQTGRAQPGSLHEPAPDTLSTEAKRTPHFLGLGETLALGRELGLPMPSQVRLFAIEVADPFTLGTSLSPALETALPTLVQTIRERLERW